MTGIVNTDGKPIREKTQNMYNMVRASDILSRIDDMLAPNGPFYVDANTLKITCMPVLLTNKPWVNINYDKKPTEKDCVLFNDILFEKYGIHPTFCKNVCWKIVTHPTNFHDLIQLIEIQRNILEESKVGIEMRPKIPHNYGGYIYCNKGLQKARMIKVEMQKKIDGIFERPVEVKLKRGCTEMEERFGPSKSWKPTTEHHRTVEKYISDHFDIPQLVGKYPDFPNYKVMRIWMDFAWERGDLTVEAYNEGKPLHEIKIDYY